MSAIDQPFEYFRALQDFRKARRRATLERLLSKFSKSSSELLSYDEVRSKLKGLEVGSPQLEDIPLDSIVGSVGRYSDFSQSFLPRDNADAERWASVKVAMTTGPGLPPIDVYQVGDAYFVLDGNHRVSIARQMGAKMIEAYVHKVQTKASFLPEDGPEALIIKEEFTNFLNRSRLDQIRPQSDLEVTVCGIYPVIEEHISVHRYYMGVEQGREISHEEAAADWYDHVYSPIIETIRSLDLLKEFPGRTETDLYVWLSKHQAELSEALDWEIDLEEAAEDLVREQGGVTGFKSKVTPGSPVASGSGSEMQTAADQQVDQMFGNILVPITGRKKGWTALSQAAELVRREGGRIRGLHIVAEGDSATSEAVQKIEEEFQQRCASEGVTGDFAAESGKVALAISDRAQWNDLVVLHVGHPPPEKALASLSSGLRTLILHCPRPILAVADQISHFGKFLIAYDGSPKAREALYVASYLSGKWGSRVTVLSVDETRNDPNEDLAHAQQYLGLCGCEGNLIAKTAPVPDAVLETAESEACDVILMGGYSHAGVLEAVLGSTVDQVLRTSRIPVLICR